MLVALVGLSPAVLTETVYALAREDPDNLPDRIWVITTIPGKERINELLFRQEGWKALLKTLCNLYGEDKIKGKLRFGLASDCIRLIPDFTRNHDLEDVRSPADNDAVADFLLETLRGPSENADIRITASIAGGRKTMGALLLMAMSILGRFQDRVLHVLVSEPWERQANFLFPDCPGVFADAQAEHFLNSAEAKVELAELPFLPLRYIFEKEIGQHAGSFHRTIARLRQRAASLEDEIETRCDLAEGMLFVDGKQVRLTSKEFGLFAAFAERAEKELEPFTSFDQLEAPLLDFARRHQPQGDFDHWSHAILESNWDPQEDFRKIASSIRARLREAGFDKLQISRLVPRRGRLSIDLSPDQVHIISSADRPSSS